MAAPRQLRAGVSLRVAAAAAAVTLLVACQGASRSASTMPAARSVPPSPSAAALAASTAPVVRIALPGRSPAALAVDGERIWVYAIESGDISRVNLETLAIEQTVHVGGLGSHVVVTPAGTVVVARFETGGSGDHLVLIDPDSGSQDGVATGPLGGLALDSDGDLLALEKAERLLRVDAVSGVVLGSTPVSVLDEHMEVVVAANSAWVASDHTGLQRLSIPELDPLTTLDVGGGIPFIERDGVLWGARPGALWSVDPASNTPARRLDLPDVTEVFGLDIDGDDAWIAVRRTGRVGAVLRLDLRSGSISATAPVSLPAAVKIVGNRVWVASYLTNELLGFDR